ncbi:DUF1573 domain-containing protein [Thermogutta sp.]|uniref:DUF1573 domain-containing protein n=1 Tax=Thermogutta sp. TaxID=1962930 RepID=UPI00321F93D1
MPTATRTILTAAFGTVFLFASASARAQKWAEAMFDHTSHNFGMVARGAKVEHVFPLKNIYVEDVHIASVRTSCGCTQPRITKDTLKTFETGAIIATVDTRGFLGRKDATITVTFDKPYPAEVQLHTYVYIRSDVVFDPGVVLFNAVPQGTAAERTVKLLYAGRSDWQIVKAVPSAEFLEVQINQTGRGAGEVTYQLVVTLKPSAPAGYLQEQIELFTNDTLEEARRLVLPVEGSVVPQVTVQPSQLALGTLSPGQTVTKNLVVQARVPFRVTGLQVPDKRFSFVLPDTEKSVQVIPVSFTADETAGPIHGEIVIETNLSGYEQLKVPVLGTIKVTGQ